MNRIATFYTHFGAIRWEKQCDAAGIPARLSPVPREISSSCGTCVFFESDTPLPFAPRTDELESVLTETPEGYRREYASGG